MPLNIVCDKIQPFQMNENLRVVTFQGFLENPDQPIIWRGPVKMGVILQLLADVDWGELDFLIIDSPPGTGDEPLTIAQRIPDCPRGNHHDAAGNSSGRCEEIAQLL
jgi:Mrp family chromosome partitioning ATPase